MNCIAITPQLRRCRRKARFFGKWAGGGLCLEHAEEHARSYGDNQFHDADRVAMQAARRERAITSIRKDNQTPERTPPFATVCPGTRVETEAPKSASVPGTKKTQPKPSSTQ